LSESATFAESDTAETSSDGQNIVLEYRSTDGTPLTIQHPDARLRRLLRLGSERRGEHGSQASHENAAVHLACVPMVGPRR
jgi:hypothetical protein